MEKKNQNYTIKWHLTILLSILTIIYSCIYLYFINVRKIVRRNNEKHLNADNIISLKLKQKNIFIATQKETFNEPKKCNFRHLKFNSNNK